MLNEFKKFKGFEVLEYFIFNPGHKVNINQLSRNLKISKRTSKYYCDFFHSQNLLNCDSLGNSKFFFINNNYPTINLWKKTIYIQHLIDKGLIKVINNPFYIYGSIAKGTYNIESDIDIFVIQINKGKLDLTTLKLNKEVNLIVVPYYELPKFKKSNSNLIEQIKKYGIYFGDDGHEL